MSENRVKAGEGVRASFATSLVPMLGRVCIDSVINARFSASGDIQAGAVDGGQHGYRAAIHPRYLQLNRSAMLHETNSCDIQSTPGGMGRKIEALGYSAKHDLRPAPR